MWSVYYNGSSVGQGSSTVSPIYDVDISESYLFNNSVGILSPRRATFVVYLDASPIHYDIKDGLKLIDKTISGYFINLIQDGITRFTGYIDVSKCKYNKKDETIEIFSYDYVELLNVYSEFTTKKLYGGLSSSPVYDYFYNYLLEIAVRLNWSYTPTPEDNIVRPDSSGSQEICKIKLHQYGSYTPAHIEADPLIPFDKEDYGFHSPDTGATILYITWGIFITSHNTGYAFAKVYRLFPGHGYSEYATWESGEPIADYEDSYADWFKEITETLLYAGIYRWNPTLQSQLSGFTQTFETGNTEVTIHQTGSHTAPSYFFGKDCEKPYNGNLLTKNDELTEEISYLPIIKDLLLINAGTIVCTDDGLFSLRNIDQESLQSHTITEGIIFYETNIINVPFGSDYVELSGNCKATKTITEGIYSEIFGIRKELTLILDNLDANDIHVSEDLTIYGEKFKIKSIKREYKKDEYNIKGLIVDESGQVIIEEIEKLYWSGNDEYPSLILVAPLNAILMRRGAGNDGYINTFLFHTSGDFATITDDLEHENADVMHNCVVKITDSLIGGSFRVGSTGTFRTFTADLDFDLTTKATTGYITYALYPSIVVIDSTHVLIACAGSGTDAYIVSLVFDADGDNIAKVDDLHHDYNGGFNSMVKIDDLHYLNAFHNNAGQGELKVFTFDETPVLGDNISQVSNLVYDTGGGEHNSLVKMSGIENHYILAYSNSDGTGCISTIFVDPDDSYAISVVDKVVHDEASAYNSLAEKDSSIFVLAFSSSISGGAGYIKAFEVDGSGSISQVQSLMHESADCYYNSLILKSGNEFVLAYGNELYLKKFNVEIL